MYNLELEFKYTLYHFLYYELFKEGLLNENF